MAFPAAEQDPTVMAKRRQVRDIVSMIVAGGFVVAIFATFYKILVS